MPTQKKAFSEELATNDTSVDLTENEDQTIGDEEP